MEGIVSVDKTKYLDHCKDLVQEVFREEILSEKLLTALTIDIMDTCLELGGDYQDDNIINVANQYRDMGGLNRVRDRIGE